MVFAVAAALSNRQNSNLSTDSDKIRPEAQMQLFF